MLESSRIDLDPPGLVGKHAIPNDFGRTLRWANMDHVERAFDQLRAVAALHLEERLFAWAVDGLEVRSEVQPRVVFLDVAHQARDVVIHAEENGSCCVADGVAGMRGAVRLVSRSSRKPPRSRMRLVRTAAQVAIFALAPGRLLSPKVGMAEPSRPAAPS